MITRRSTQRRWDINMLTDANFEIEINKLSIKNALNGKREKESKAAILDEIKTMLDYKVGRYIKYDDIPQEKKKNILRAFMFMKEKHKPDEEFRNY
jgi:hypothetical protein